MKRSINDKGCCLNYRHCLNYCVTTYGHMHERKESESQHSLKMSCAWQWWIEVSGKSVIQSTKGPTLRTYVGNVPSHSMHTHTHTHTRIHTRTHTHMQTRTHQHVHTHTHTICWCPKYHQQSQSPVSLHFHCKKNGGNELTSNLLQRRLLLSLFKEVLW